MYYECDRCSAVAEVIWGDVDGSIHPKPPPGWKYVRREAYTTERGEAHIRSIYVCPDCAEAWVNEIGSASELIKERADLLARIEEINAALGLLRSCNLA